MSIPGYRSFVKNRVDKNCDGIATLVSEKDSPHVLRIKEGPNDNEFIITSHDQFAIPINVVDIYRINEC